MTNRKALITQLLGLLREEERADGTVVCPELCSRYRISGACVHTKLPVGIEKGYTTAYKKAQEARREQRIQVHKAQESLNVAWECVVRDEWKRLPFTYGVYLWTFDDKVIYYAKATDFRRRHFTWNTSKDARWLAAEKIWWVHTGWYEEILLELDKLEIDTCVDSTVLNSIIARVRPLQLPLPPGTSR